MRFGEAAIDLGLVRPRDVQRALKIQGWRRQRGEPVPLIGEVLHEIGKLRADQVEEVFGAVLDGRAGGPRRSPGWWGRLLGRA